MFKRNNYLKKGGKTPKYALGKDLAKEANEEEANKTSFGNELLKYGRDNSGQLINLATYAKNVSDVNKFDTNINRVTPIPIYTKAPNYLPKALNEISGEVRNINRGIDNSSSSIKMLLLEKLQFFLKG